MKHSYILLLFLLLIASCGKKTPSQQSASLPPIFPDYAGVTIPLNIAPLNFGIRGAEHIQVEILAGGNTVIDEQGEEYIEISPKEWSNVLQSNKGKSLEVKVSAWTKEFPNGVAYKPFPIYVDDSQIDDYVAYRLIPPGYLGWKKMAIMQRNLTNFDESPIILNSQNEGGCVNCHNFCQGSPDCFMFHARNAGGGTVIVKDGKMEKVNITKTNRKLIGTYPNWHPGGRYIAFSANDVHQAFYSHTVQKIEVYDLASDLIVYDTQTKKVLEDSRFCDSLNLETFPTFSPDGKYLYFCTSKPHSLPYASDSMRYSIVRVPFFVIGDNAHLGAKIDTVYSASRDGGSASLPKISPDGRYLLFTWASSNTFHIQHPEADLRLVDLKTGQVIIPQNINSDKADSYHSWSSNGKWVIFASRRMEGRTTNLYIASFKNGKFGKPFLLPQEDPETNVQRYFSYNVPELVKGKVEMDKDKLARMLQKK